MGSTTSAYGTITDSGGQANPTEATAKPKTTEDDILDDFENSTDLEPLMPGLTPELEAALIGLVTEFERESYPTWRFLNRDFLEAESFWKGLQNGYYDYRFDMWRVPTIKDLSNMGESGQRFDFTTNIYRALGWTLISVLGQKMPTVRFLPHDYREQSDVTAARAAVDVMPIVERNNRINLLNLRAAYLLYTHGIVASYTRFIADGEKFGFKEDPQIELQKIKLEDAVYNCPGCFQVQPAAMGLQQCASCGQTFSETDYQPAQMADVPVITGTQKVPRGQEVVTIHSGLEMRLPPWEGELVNCPYIELVNEIHLAQLRATYGKRAKNLQGGYGSGPYDTWDRFSRLALIEPTVSYYSTSNQNLVTTKRAWLRTKSFYMLDDDKRDALLELFPDGAYIVFADTRTLLDARNERIEDHWRICKAMEGPGMYTPALGSDVISIQKRFNVLHNFIMEWVEYAAAGQGTFINSSVINVRALSQQRKAPGYIYPVKVPAGQPISNAIHESRPGTIAGELFRHAEDLQQLGQFVSGSVPTVSGGTEQSLKPSTYLADREQALGKLYVPWAHLRTFWAETMFLAVKEFSRWRTEDEFYALFGQRGEVEGKEVRLADLQGNFDAYPEANENFPVLWHQMQATFMQLMQSPDQFLQEVAGHPNNLSYVKAMLQIPDVYIPGEDDRTKQEQEIVMLLQGQPQQTIDQLTGQAKLIPSIPIDPFEDNHQVHIEDVKEWAVSPRGLEAKRDNPMGYKNVIAHGVMHEDYLHQMMAMAQMAGGAPPAPGGPEKKPAPTVSGGGGSGAGGGSAQASKAKLEKDNASPGVPS
jgi:ribosomal protein L37AE/L43A